MVLPKLLLRPVRDNYGITPGETVVAVTLKGGASRMRKDQIGATALIPVNWILNGADYEYIWAFYNTQLDSGSLPFLMDLLWEKQTLQEYVCQIVPGSFQLTQQAGLAYYMQAQLEVFPNPPDVAGDNTILARNA